MYQLIPSVSYLVPLCVLSCARSLFELCVIIAPVALSSVPLCRVGPFASLLFHFLFLFFLYLLLTFPGGSAAFRPGLALSLCLWIVSFTALLHILPESRHSPAASDRRCATPPGSGSSDVMSIY